MAHKDREVALAYYRLYHKTHPDPRTGLRKRKRSKVWEAVVPDVAPVPEVEVMAPRKSEPIVVESKKRESGTIRRKKYYQATKQQVFEAYGGAICKCCGEAIAEFLTLDHVKGDGSRDRKLGRRGFALFLWIRRSGFPPGFQVLCFNCNCGRAINGGICPHHATRLQVVAA